MIGRGAAAVTLALAALTTLGCATLPPCPAKGGPRWIEVTTPHFAVHSDLDQPAAEEIARHLEELRTALLVVGWRGVSDPPGRLDVVAFRARDELLEFLPDGIAGTWIRRPPFVPTVVLYGAGVATPEIGAADPAVHELTHELGHRFIPVQPPWLAEGMATFFETATYDRATRKATIGIPSGVRLIQLANDGRLRPESFVNSKREPTDAMELARFEAASWLLFHYLMDEHPNALITYQRLVGFVPADVAWTRAFPDLPFDRLDRELNVYLRDRKFKGGSVTLPIESDHLGVREMSDAEVHAWRAHLYATWPQKDGQRRAREEIAEALAQDPDDIRGLAVGFYETGAAKDQRVAWARRAAARHPTDGLAAIMVADTSGLSAPETRDALVKALARSPSDREVVSRLAMVAAAAGRWDQALTFSTQALHFGAFYDKPLVLLHTEALARAGRCPEASAFEATLDSLPADAREALAREVGRCVPRPPTGDDTAAP